MAETPPVAWQDYLRAAILPAAGVVFLRFALALTIPALAVMGMLAGALAGYYAVRLFERRTAPVAGLWQGCGLGLLAGLLAFLPALAAQLLTFATGGRELFLSALREQAGQSPMMRAALTALEDPAVFAAVVAVQLFFEAAVLVALATAGGALAARASLRRPG